MFENYDTLSIRKIKIIKLKLKYLSRCSFNMLAQNYIIIVYIIYLFCNMEQTP